MQRLLDTLNSLTPAMIIGGLVLFTTLETWHPYFKQDAGRSRQRWRNIAVLAILVPLSVGLSAFVPLTTLWSEKNSFGLLHRLSVMPALAIVVGIFFIDLCLYALHVTVHHVPVLWRIHRMHHADTDMDASTGLRQHPFEMLLQMGMLTTVLPLFGIPFASYVLYSTVALPWFLLNHSNIRYPEWVERWGSLVMSTPNWHRIHHSSFRPETDSHYGCVLSIWDRLFGTTRKTQVESIRFGLEKFRSSDEQTVWQLLKMPFREL